MKLGKVCGWVCVRVGRGQVIQLPPAPGKSRAMAESKCSLRGYPPPLRLHKANPAP